MTCLSQCYLHHWDYLYLRKCANFFTFESFISNNENMILLNIIHLSLKYSWGNSHRIQMKATETWSHINVFKHQFLAILLQNLVKIYFTLGAMKSARRKCFYSVWCSWHHIFYGFLNHLISINFYNAIIILIYFKQNATE